MSDRFKITVAANTLRSGGVIAYPTETVYGIGCDPNNGSALRRILDLKNRSPLLGMILLADSWQRLASYIDVPNDSVWKKIKQPQSKPTTWLVPAGDVHPLVVGSHPNVAVRITDHPLCRDLCSAFGDAVVSTSANLTGKRPAANALQVFKQFGQRLDGVLYGRTANDKPSTIINAIDDTVIRTT